MDNEQANYKVYCLTNLINGKKYVGMTKRTLEARSGSRGRNYEECTAIWDAIKEFGWENFSKEILFEGLTFEQACEQEMASIIELNSRFPNGYNLEGGGKVGKDVAPLVRELMQERNARWRNDPEHQEYLRRKNAGSGNPMYGKHLSDDAKEKLRKSHLGKKHSEESIKKMRENHTHYHDSFHPMARSVMQFSLDGEYIKTYPCVKDAQDATGSKSIYSCLSQKTNRAGGYIWKYVDEKRGEGYERKK